MPIGMFRFLADFEVFWASHIWQRILTSKSRRRYDIDLLFVLVSHWICNITPRLGIRSVLEHLRSTRFNNQMLTPFSLAFVDIDYTPPRLLTTKINL
jgi:hypothetical protein